MKYMIFGITVMLFSFMVSSEESALKVDVKPPILEGKLTASDTNIKKTDIKLPLLDEINKVGVNKTPEVNVNLNKPVNWYMLSLPFITITLIIGSTIISIRTINAKTEEAKSSFTESLKMQKEISENQIKVTILSESRREWINALRDELSIFISCLHEMEHFYDTATSGSATNDTHKDLTELYSKIELRASKITLLVNPSEDDHAELTKLIKKSLTKHGKGFKHVFALSEEIIVVSQKILKREWEVVKAFN